MNNTGGKYLIPQCILTWLLICFYLWILLQIIQKVSNTSYSPMYINMVPYSFLLMDTIANNTEGKHQYITFPNVY